MPYGVTDEPWDELLTDDNLGRILKQFNASKRSIECFVFLWHKPDQTLMVVETLKKNGFQECQHIYWHKKDQNSPTPQTSYTSSVEMGSIAFSPNRAKVPFNMSKSARERHNFIDLPSITTYHKDVNGERVNTCQKPSGLMKWLIGNHCPPHSTVLVVGAGSGGEVQGALEAGCNVIAVEQDERQYKLLQKIAMEWSANLTKSIYDEAANLASGKSPKKDPKPPASSSSLDSGSVGSATQPVAGEKPCVSCNMPIAPDEDQAKCEHSDCEGAVFHGKCVVVKGGKSICVDHAK